MTSHYIILIGKVSTYKPNAYTMQNNSNPFNTILPKIIAENTQKWIVYALIKLETVKLKPNTGYIPSIGTKKINFSRKEK